ncbi:MAG: glycosyltransferase family 4 protein [Arenicellaceae bacterium]|nr:glycosyltransferase family 4 protein [Arenicellaceae bacterium]
MSDNNSNRRGDQVLVISHNTSQYLFLHYQGLVRELVRQYKKVICLTPVDGWEHELKQLGIQHIALNMQQHGLNVLREIGAILQYRDVYKINNADVVFNFSIKPILYGAIAAKLLGIKHRVAMVTGLGYLFIGSSLLAKLVRIALMPLYRKLYGLGDVMFFQNRDDQQVFESLGIGRLANKEVISGTGVDTAYFNQKPIPPVGIEGPIFLYVGRMLRDKGLWELVEAVRLLKSRGKQFKCQLLGPVDSSPASIQSDELGRLEDQQLVEYLGETRDVRPYIERSHIFVLPSYREGLPRAALEAMSMGRGVITTDVPGCKEVVKDNGLLVPAREAEALASAMGKVIDKPSLIQQYGERSRELVKQEYELGIVIEQVSKAMPCAYTERRSLKKC